MPASFGGVHPSLEFPPASLRQFDISPGDGSAVLAQHVEQDQEVARASIEDPVQLAAGVAANSKQPDAARAYIRYLASAAASAAVAKTGLER